MSTDLKHAYLLYGARGTGKTTCARILSMAAVCKSKDANGLPCSTCENCRQVALGTHPDVLEIDAAQNNGVANAHEWIEQTEYAPIVADRKVFIIDEAHSLTAQAQNALLKTLEEAPKYIMFIFCTTEPSGLLATIRSRTQGIGFRPINQDNIVGKLKTICNEMNFSYEEAGLQMIASEANGGMRDAEGLLEMCLPDLTVENISAILGRSNQDEIRDFVVNYLDRKEKESADSFTALCQTASSIIKCIATIQEQVANDIISLGSGVQIKDMSTADIPALREMISFLSQVKPQLKSDIGQFTIAKALLLEHIYNLKVAGMQKNNLQAKIAEIEDRICKIEDNSSLLSELEALKKKIDKVFNSENLHIVNTETGEILTNVDIDDNDNSPADTEDIAVSFNDADFEVPFDEEKPKDKEAEYSDFLKSLNINFPPSEDHSNPTGKEAVADEQGDEPGDEADELPNSGSNLSESSHEQHQETESKKTPAEEIDWGL